MILARQIVNASDMCSPVNNVILIGRLVCNPNFTVKKRKRSNCDMDVCKMVLKVENPYRPDANANYFKVRVYGSEVSKCRALKSNDICWVTGRLRSVVTEQEDVRYASVIVIASSIQMLDEEPTVTEL